MSKKLFALCALVLFVGVAGVSALEPAPFCYDNTDKLIVKLKKLDLTTDQLKDVFAYQASHREFMSACHKEGRGCRAHEHAEVDFEKNSIGVLTDEQFKKFKGRTRNESEQLRYENYLLKKEIARLKAQLESLKKTVEAAR